MRSRPSYIDPTILDVTGQEVEQIGNLTGSDDWKASGAKEHAEGDAEYKAAQAKGCECPLTWPSLCMTIFSSLNLHLNILCAS